MTEPAEGTHGLTGRRLVALRTRRYAESLRWLLVTLVKFRPVSVTVIMALVAFGRSMQAAAFAAVIWYFSAVERGGSIEILGQALDPRAGWTMAAAVAAIAAALVAATFVVYISARLGFTLAMAFAEHVIETALNVEGAFPSRMMLGRQGLTSRQLQELVAAKIHLFRPIHVLLSLPRALLLAIPAISGMIWIAGEVVAFLAVLAAPAVALNYLISRRVVVVQREHGKAQGLYKAELREAMEAIGDESRPDANRNTIAARLLEGPASRNSVRTFSARILSPAQSEFVSNVLAAVAVASIGLYLGFKAISGTMPLAVVIGFFMLLRFSIGGLTSITMSLTTYARFYAVVRKAYEYITSPIAAEAKVARRPVLHGPVGESPVPGHVGKDVPLERGIPVAVISPAQLNRFTQYFFAFALTQKARHRTRQMLNAAMLRCSLSLLDRDGLATRGIADLGEEELWSRLEEKGVGKIAPPYDLIHAAASGQLPQDPADCARLVFVAAVLSEADAVLVDSHLASVLPKAEFRKWIGGLKDRYVAIAYPVQKFRKCFGGEAHAILLDNDRAVAIVDAANAREAAAFVKKNLKAVEDDEEDTDLEEE